MIDLTSVIHDQETNSVEATWVDADGIPTKCHSYADVQMQMLRDDALELGTPLAEYEDLIALVESRIVPYVPPPVTPTALIKELEASITPRRFREALLSGDFTFLSSVEAQIEALRLSPAGA